MELAWSTKSVQQRKLFPGTNVVYFYAKTIVIAGPFCSQALQSAAKTLQELQHRILSVVSVRLGYILASEMSAI